MSGFDWHSGEITRATVVTADYRNTQKVRRFFRAACGAGFKFDRAFMAWMKSGVPRTMGEAANEWTRRFTKSAGVRSRKSGGSVEMDRIVIVTERAPKPPPFYSQAVKAAGLVFVSGTFPTDPATGKFAGDTIQEQTAQCLRNISAILEAAGTSLDRAVSATVIMAEEEDFSGLNEEWAKWFPVDPPARQGAKLPVRIPGMRISIAMVAAV